MNNLEKLIKEQNEIYIKEKKHRLFQTVMLLFGNSLAILMLLMAVAVLFLIAYKFGILLTWIN